MAKKNLKSPVDNLPAPPVKRVLGPKGKKDIFKCFLETLTPEQVPVAEREVLNIFQRVKRINEKADRTAAQIWRRCVDQSRA